MIVLPCSPLTSLLEFCVSDSEWDREVLETEWGSSPACETSSLLSLFGINVKRDVKPAQMTE